MELKTQNDREEVWQVSRKIEEVLWALLLIFAEGEVSFPFSFFSSVILLVAYLFSYYLGWEVEGLGATFHIWKPVLGTSV